MQSCPFAHRAGRICRKIHPARPIRWSGPRCENTDGPNLTLGVRQGFHCTAFRQSSKSLSRAERRALERKQRNKERRSDAAKQQQLLQQQSSFSSIPALAKIQWNQQTIKALQKRMEEFFHPGVLGSGQRIHRDHLWTLLVYRLPIACLLGYLAMDPDISPYTIQASLGPSMLPTIQFIGDLWLVETGAWRRLLGWDWTTLQVGDVVLWKDKKTGRVSCKRIVGLPGDTVQRFGEFAALYKDENYGIVWPTATKDEGALANTMEWDPSVDNHDVDRTFTIPEGQVWLEGDCPPFSLDSRHYGPIPLKWICGRLILRLWPWNDNLYFQDLPIRRSSWIRSMPRPMPFSSVDEYLGKRFNFYRVKAIAAAVDTDRTDFHSGFPEKKDEAK